MRGMGTYPTYRVHAQSTCVHEKILTYTHLIDDARQDNLADIHPKVGLELEASFAVEEKIPREARPVFAEPLVERIFAESTEPLHRCVEKVVEVALVLLVVEAAPVLAERVGLVVALRLQNEAGVQQNLSRAHVSVRTMKYNKMLTLRVYVSTSENHCLSSASSWASL